MADLYEPDFGTSSYRSKDPVKNFKLRVRLERVTSASIVPQAQLEREAGGNFEMQDLQQNMASQSEVEEYTFKWQEKLFSQREIELYGNEDNCFTVLERKYHEDSKLYKEVGRPTQRLFSYVDHDSFTNRDENVVKMTTSPNETPTALEEKMTNLRHRRATPNRFKDGYNINNLPKINLVDYAPSEEAQKQNHLLSTPMQTMYIMADLSPERDATEEDEFVLCTVRVDANGVINIRPDFNKGRKAYRVESAGMGRDVFEFTINHASQQLTRQEQDREAKMIQELYTKHVEYLTSLVGHEMEMPAADSLRVLVYGEIISAKDFEYDDLYIHYFWELPLNWHPQGLQQMAGVTQTCSTKVIGRDNVAYFSFPFQFEVIYRRDFINNKDEDILPKWPQLFLEVMSLDSWERHRTEGYAYMTLPSTPGAFTETINCWRPVGRSCMSEVRRFFIGGSPELEEPTYVAAPSTFEGKRLSKYGFRTESTGSVTLKLNILQQSQAFLRSATSRKKVGTILDRLGHSAAQANIMNVLEAFQRAKQRMVAARDNLKKEYLETLRAAEPEEEEDD